MKYAKPPLSLNDQIQKLKDRGLQIKDDALVQRYLSNISYYRLRAYTYPFQNNAMAEQPFIGKVDFDDVMALYTFDRKLRLLIFDAVEKIEIALRTQIIYQWSMLYGSHWHLDQQLYKDRSKFIKHLNSLQKEINRSNETFLDHYKTKYTQPQEPPCWMSLEVSSIGLLSLIFQNLKNCPAKKAVTHHFGLKSPKVLENWIHHFCNIRNICAHHGRLWNRRIATPITIPQKINRTFLTDKHLLPYKLYAGLSAMLYILQIINPESTFKQELLRILQNGSPAQYKEMGFTTHWKNEKLWQI